MTRRGRDIIVIDDDFEQMAEMGREQQHRPPAEEKLTPWQMLSKGRTLGKRIGIAVVDDGAGATTETTASLNMFEVSADDAASMPLTITLAPPRIAIGASSSNLANLSGSQDNKQALDTVQAKVWYSAVAVIEWGTGGVSNKAEIDFINGAKICLAASYVRISAFMENPPADQGGSVYELAAFISPGTDKGLGAQRTIICDSVPAAANTEYPTAEALPVPAFARRVRVCGTPFAYGGFVGYIRFYRDKNFVSPVCEYLFAENTPDSFFIPAGCFYFNFVTGAANMVSMQAIFDLAI